MPPSEIVCPYLMFSAVFSPRSFRCCCASDVADGSSVVLSEEEPNWPVDFDFGITSEFSPSYLRGISMREVADLSEHLLSLFAALLCVH